MVLFLRPFSSKITTANSSEHKLLDLKSMDTQICVCTRVSRRRRHTLSTSSVASLSSAVCWAPLSTCVCDCLCAFARRGTRGCRDSSSPARTSSANLRGDVLSWGSRGGVLSEGRVSSAFSEVVAPLFTLADEPEMDLLLFGRALVYFCLLFVNLLSVCSFSGTAFSGNGCFYFLF